MQSLARALPVVVALIGVATLAACSDQSTTPAPVKAVASSAISLGDTVNRTLVDSVGPDTLVLDADRVLRLHVDLQQSGDAALVAGALTYSVVAAATGTRLASGASLSSTSGLGPDVGDPSLAWFRLPQAGKFFVVVSRTSAAQPYRGGYRLRLVGSDPAPEHAPARLAFGDSVVESIDRPGDVDEFLLTGRASGSSPMLVLKAETGHPGDTLIVETTTDSPPKRLAVSATGDIGAFGAVTPIVPGSGDSVRVRIRALSGATVGQYRIKWLAVSDAPEGVKDTLTAGDTVAASIEFPGDVDVFTFVPDPSKTYSLAAQALSDRATDHLLFQVRGVANDSLKLAVAGGTRASLVSQMTPLFQSNKPITIRVTSDGTISGPAPYQLAVLEVSTHPETALDTLTYGDTISESIDVKADIDEFIVKAQRGDTVIVFAQAVADTVDATVRFGVETSGFAGIAGLPLAARLAFAVPTGLGIGAVSSFAMVATDSGPYTVTVKGQGDGAGGPYNYLGRYRLVVVKISGNPELVSPALAPNVVVTEEGFPTGEIDHFVFNGAVGQEVAVYLSVAATAELRSVVFTVQNGSFFYAGTSTDSLGLSGSPRWLLSDAPTFINVQPLSSLGRSFPYRLWVYPVDRHPESASSVLHIGDVVSNEELFPSADIDEFTVSAAPGAKFMGCLFNRAQKTGVEGMSLTVESAGTRTGFLAAAPGCTATQVVPASGAMTLRVSTSLPRGGAYELRVVAVP
ncbi:MAG TPA: hypothetical protein VI259_19900 [Gemmatimonadaceae bacterium]